MMMGRDESMPNNVREPDLTSEERDIARAIALDILHGNPNLGALSPKMREVLARAVMRYVPAGVPVPAPLLVAEASDRTMPAPLPSAPDLGTGRVIGVVDPEPSDGICEATGDDDATRQAQVDHTAMHRSQDGQAYVVKRGANERISIPHIPDTTRK